MLGNDYKENERGPLDIAIETESTSTDTFKTLMSTEEQFPWSKKTFTKNSSFENIINFS